MKYFYIDFLIHKTSNNYQNDEYFIEGEDLSLIATAEIPLTGYHADDIINEEDLPLLYTGYSPCYRKEAGTYGKHTRGLFRVHQFNKLEMYAFTLPEQSGEIHEKILAIEEEIWQRLIRFFLGGAPQHFAVILVAFHQNPIIGPNLQQCFSRQISFLPILCSRVYIEYLTY